MTKEEFKLAIIQWVMQEDDEKKLSQLWKLLSDKDRESATGIQLAGYSARGVRITRNQLIEMLVESSTRPVMTMADLETSSENW